VCSCLTLGRETPAGVALGVTDWKVVERKRTHGLPWRVAGHPRAKGSGPRDKRSALARRDDHHHLRSLAAAAREACSTRHVSMTISLAFLAPSLVKAARQRAFIDAIAFVSVSPLTTTVS
jgi:hypothetical protein